MLIIAKNNRNYDLPLHNLSVTDQKIPANGQANLTQHNTIFRIQADPQIRDYLNTGDVTLNDGSKDLILSEAMSVLTAVVSSTSIYKFTEAPEKISAESGDIFLVEDSSDNFSKKKISAENLVFLGAGTIVYAPQEASSTGIAMTVSQTSVPIPEMEIQLSAGNHIVWFGAQLKIPPSGVQLINIGLYLDETLISITKRVFELKNYYNIQVRTTIENVEEGQTIRAFWSTEKGKHVISEARSLMVHKYV